MSRLNHKYRVSGTVIQKARTKAGMGQRELASRLTPPTSVQFVSNIEIGRHAVPSSRIVEFAKALGIDPMDLVDGLLKDRRLQIVTEVLQAEKR